MTKHCKDCYFYELCEEKGAPCMYYAPLTEFAEEEALEQYIENEREQYLHDWNIYVSEFEG